MHNSLKRNFTFKVNRFQYSIPVFRLDAITAAFANSRVTERKSGGSVASSIFRLGSDLNVIRIVDT